VRPLQWQWAIRDTDLDATSKYIALVLSTFMNGQTGSTHVSREKLAERTGKSVDTVDRALVILVALGWLLKKQGGGRGWASTYTAAKGRTSSALLPGVKSPTHTALYQAAKQALKEGGMRKSDAVAEKTAASATVNSRISAEETAAPMRLQEVKQNEERRTLLLRFASKKGSRVCKKPKRRAGHMRPLDTTYKRPSAVTSTAATEESAVRRP
jgi:hypothetical protein